MSEQPETPKEAELRHVVDNASIAVVSQQVSSLKEIVTLRLDNQDGQLQDIKTQTTKTNGSVATAFIQIADINAWKNRIIGGLVVSNIIIVPVVMWLVFQRLGQSH